MTTQRASHTPCVLVQSLPLGSRVAPSPSQPPYLASLARAGTAFNPYRITTRITQIDRAIIRAFMAEYYCALTTSTARAISAGLESHGHWLPGGTLPDAFLTQALPAALECKLSELPAGFERVLLGRDVLLLATATREILDVMTNAGARSGLPRHASRERRRVNSRFHGAQRDAASKWRLFELDSIL